MQKLQLHIRDSINASSETFNGLRTQFRAIPSHVVTVIAESDLERLDLGEVIRDSGGLTYVVIDAQTVANHLMLTLLPVPATY